MTAHFASADDFVAAVGTHLGESDWMVVDQERVNGFADATGDHQWIHVDVERAKDGPFGGTIAHGYLTLSLLPVLMRDVITVDAAIAINYGLNKVRFINPVLVGSRVRASIDLVAAEPVAGGVQATYRSTIEIEGAEKPACVVENIGRFTF